MASATELVHIALNAGQREDIDKRLLPHNLLRVADNVRLRKAGSIGVRFGYSALTMTEVGGSTVEAYDVASHDDELLVFGSVSTGAAGPEKVFSYNATLDRWRGETHSTAVTSRLFNSVSQWREVFRPGFAKTDEAQLYDLAYAGGYLALVYEGHADDSLVFVHIFDPATGAQLFETAVSARTHPRVAAAGTLFVFAWQDSSDDVRCVTFDPASSTALSSETVVHNAGTVGDGIDLAPVSGASEAMLLVVRSDTNAATVYRLNTSLATVDSVALTATDVSLGSVASVTAATTSVAYVDTSGNYELETFDTATLTSADGPTALFGGSTGSRPPTLVYKNATQLTIAAAITDTIDSQLKVDVRAISGHAAAAQYTQREVSLQSKLFVSPDAQFVGGVAPYGEGGLVGFSGIVDVELGRGYEGSHHRGYAVDALATWLGSVATDGTQHWAVMPVDDLTCSHLPVVVGFTAMGSHRRQTAELGGKLYVAGGFLGHWDGQRLVESGYPDAPVIESVTASNGAGSLTNSATYSYVAHYEWRDAKGDRHQSPVSDPVVVVMGASDDTNAVVVSTPHTIRRVVGSDTGGKVVVSRTKAAPDRVHRRAGQVFANSTYAQSVTFTDTASDTEITTQEIVYTQGARGSLSGPLQHTSAFPSKYVWAKRDRLLLGGLPNDSQWQQSKTLFPVEPVQFSDQSNFLGAVNGAITAIASQDDIDYLFTRNRVWVVTGAGPDDNGNGEFTSPRELPGDKVGCVDWRSVVVTSQGVWFQSDRQRLYLIPRGGGAAQWQGQPLRDTLETYPVITAACVVSNDNVVCWAAQNAAGSAGVLIVHDLRSGDWYVDDVDDIGAPIASMCEHLGRLVVVAGGDVFQQDNTFPAAAFIDYGVTLGTFAGSGTEGWCKLASVTLTCEYRGDCELTGEISYDDGVSFTNMGDSVFSTTGHTAGDTVSFQWWPYRRKGDRFVVRFTVSDLSAAATEGLLFHNLTLEVQRARKPSRKATAQRR